MNANELQLIKRRLRPILMALVAGAALLFLTDCSTVPVTGRHELNLISQGQELQLGLTSFDQAKSQTPINHNPSFNERVERVGRRLAAVAGKDLPNAQWEFVVFESNEANAWCLPGGKIGVYTGLLPITQDDAGLATVLGHEIGHAVAHHGAERMSEAMVMETGQELAGTALANNNPQLQSAALLAYGVGTKVGRELPHSRKQESEADHIGLVYMARAGYDPASAVAFWQRFAEYNRNMGGNNTPTFLRTHPLDDVRIRQIQQWLPEAQREFRPKR